jgi:hypothetical protein
MKECVTPASKFKHKETDRNGSSVYLQVPPSFPPVFFLSWGVQVGHPED